jgi:hypothetical protein
MDNSVSMKAFSFRGWVRFNKGMYRRPELFSHSFSFLVSMVHPDNCPLKSDSRAWILPEKIKLAPKR